MSKVINDYLQGVSVPLIAKEAGCSVQTIYNILKKHNIKPDRGGSRHNLDYGKSFLTVEMREFLDGLILSDGHLAKRGRNAQLEVGQKFPDCRDYFASPFRVYDPVTPQYQNAYRAITKCHPDFTVQHNRWYVPKKIVPPDLVLSPICCLVWYLGDGNLKKSKYSVHLRFATQGFTPREVNWLCEQLSGLQILSHRQKDNGIYVTTKGSKVFFDFITPAVQKMGIPKCYSYKFER